MLKIIHLEEVEALLLRVPGLVHQQEQRNAEFPPRVRAWLIALEEVFVANRLLQAGSVAAIRSALIAAEHGHVPADLAFRGRPTRSRVLDTVASQCLKQAAGLGAAVAGENRTRVAEAERIARQIIASAIARDVITAPAPDTDNTQALRGIRLQLAAISDLAAALVHIEGLVGPHDLLVLLDRALAVQLRGS